MSAFNAAVSYLMVSHSPNEKRDNCFARYDNKQLRRDRVGIMILAMEGDRHHGLFQDIPNIQMLNSIPAGVLAEKLPYTVQSKIITVRNALLVDLL